MAKKLLKCKSCGKEMAASAKNCPHCGAKGKSKTGRIIGTILAVPIILIILATNTCGGGDSSTTINEDDVIYKVGDVITTNKFEIIVSAVNQWPSVGGVFFATTAADGAVYLCVQWQYKNISGKPQGMFSLPDISLIDPNGVVYDTNSAGILGFNEVNNFDEVLFDELNPGLSVKTAAVYEVSKELLDTGGWHLKAGGELIAIE